MIRLLLILLAVTGLGLDSAASSAKPIKLRYDRDGAIGSIELFGERFEPGNPSDLAGLAVAAHRWHAEAQRVHEDLKHKTKAALRNSGRERMSTAELRFVLSEDGELLSKRERRCLLRLSVLARRAQSADEATRAAIMRELAETADAMANNRLAAAPEYVEMLATPLVAMNYSRRSLLLGDAEAGNLEVTHSMDRAPDLLDPEPSNFWRRPNPIGDQDLHAGFGRSRIPDYARMEFVYHEPKTGRGMNPGFTVKSGGIEYKLKFGEVHSEPFVGRVFHVMGYHVEPADHARHLRVKYDRRLLREFNLRQSIQMTVGFFKLFAVHRQEFQRTYDPFDYFDHVLMKDGSRMEMKDLKRLLMIEPDKELGWEDPDNYHQEVESAIDCLVTARVNIQAEDEWKTLGPWSYGKLGHDTMREVRGIGLLAAWVGWFDPKTENTKVRYQVIDDQLVTQMAFSDLGNALGVTTGWFNWKEEVPHDFPWFFTQPPIRRGPNKMTTPFRVVGYKPSLPNPAFRAMTVSDARWMARLIGQLTRTQIVDALLASGVEGDELTAYAARLLSRRDLMIRDLGLEAEIPLIAPGMVRR